MANSAFDMIIDSLKNDLDEKTIHKVINCLVKTCGGERIYIPVKINEQLMTISPDDTPKTIQQRIGCSRANSYRIKKRYRI